MTALRLTALLVAALLLTGCDDTDLIDPPPDAGTDPDATMIIESFQFRGPDEVDAGTALTVTNRDSASHTWTAEDGTFDTGTLRQGDTATVTLDAAGTYEFRCDFHPSMGGSITVIG
jgi:plastocyanin